MLIRHALNSPGPDQHERLCRLNLKLQNVVTDIRKLPGLSRFLLPSFFPDPARIHALAAEISMGDTTWETCTS